MPKPKMTALATPTPTAVTPPTSRATRTPSQVLAQQQADADRDRAARAAAAKRQKLAQADADRDRAARTAAAKPKSDGLAEVLDGAKPSTAVAPAAPTAVAVPDNRTPHERFLDEIAPVSIVGREIRFTKDGTFVTPDDEATIADDVDFIVLADQTLAGYIKFVPDGPPDRRMGLIYDGFVVPKREELGELDQADWPLGLSGAPEDPLQLWMYVVLQAGKTAELYTFTTKSKTGRRAVGNLLRHYDRRQKTHPDELPVVRLTVGGFQHRDDRIGWVPTPVFRVVGRAPRDSAAKPDTSLAADMDDGIPDFVGDKS